MAAEYSDVTTEMLRDTESRTWVRVDEDWCQIITQVDVSLDADHPLNPRPAGNMPYSVEFTHVDLTTEDVQYR